MADKSLYLNDVNTATVIPTHGANLSGGASAASNGGNIIVLVDGQRWSMAELSARLGLQVRTVTQQGVQAT